MRNAKSATRLPLVITSTFAAFLIAGCSKSGSEQQPETSKKTKSTYTLGMSQCNLGEPWRVQMNADVKAAADKRPEIKMVFKDAQNDTLKQRSHVEEFVSAGVDLIITDHHLPGSAGLPHARGWRSAHFDLLSS